MDWARLTITFFFSRAALRDLPWARGSLLRRCSCYEGAGGSSIFEVEEVGLWFMMERDAWGKGLLWGY